MPGELLAYSGLVTKARAMHGRLLSEAQMVALCECGTVDEIIGFLREYGSYASILQSHEEIAHRGEVEAVIGDALYYDYKRLYHFANGGQRKGLEIFYLRYKMPVDVQYYRMVWRMKDKLQDTVMRRIITQILGTEIDWQNIMWMYRSKRFYHRKPAEIYADMIPISYRLRKEELRALLETENLEEFTALLRKTAYFTGEDAVVKLADEITFRQIMKRTYQQLSRKYPMSLAPVLHYLYQKETEIDRLTTVLEGVRYKVPPGDIQELVIEL